MSLFDEAQTSTDPTTQEITITSPATLSDYAYGLDTHASADGGSSIFDQASDVVTKAAPLTGLQIVNSFVNTGIELANVLGTDIKPWSVQEEAPGLEEATGQTGLNDYYQQHQQGIDLASLAIGSLLPGLGAVKLFKYGTGAALAANSALLEAGDSTSILARATGLLPSTRSARIIKQATDNILNPTSLGNTFAKEKYAAIAYGFGDQALQSLVYEVATAATMKANPITDKQSFGEMAQNIIQGALIGGGIGGIIEGIGTRSIFNKMIQGADDTTKAQQIYNSLGMGDYEAGDKVNVIIHSIYNMPAPTSGLGGLYQKFTADASNLAAKKALLDLVPKGDEELTNGMFDIIQRMKNEGNVSEDGAYDYFNRLAKVQRITDGNVPQVDDGSFYINKRASKVGNNPINWNSLVSKTPSPTSDLTLKYQLKPGRFDTTIARHDDTDFDVNGNPFPLYENSQAAFDQGADLFVNPKGDVIVNPKAPNIQQVAKTGESRVLTQQEEVQYRKTGQLPKGAQPLYGTQVNIADKPGATILNTKTGAITDSAVPTLGDHGNVVYTPKGMKYGSEGKFSPQSIDDEVSADTSTIDMSARYAWIAQRGIKNGDRLISSDIASMEQLYSTLSDGDWKNNVNRLNKNKVTLDEDELPSSQQELLNQIKQAKDDQLNDDISSGMSAEEAALRANVPESYISSGFKAPNGSSDFINPPDYHSTNTHVSLWYDIGNLNMQDGNIIKGIRDTQYRVQLIRSANRDAAAAHFGEDAENFLIDGDASQAGLTNAPGAGFTKFSAAKYNSFQQQFERIGRFISGKNQADIASTQRVLAASASGLLADKYAAAEANMFRAVRQRTGESYSFLPPELEAKYLGSSNPEVATNPTGRVAVLTNALIKDEKSGVVTDFNPDYIPKGFVDASKVAMQDIPNNTSGLRNFYTLSPKVAAWERANQTLNDARVVSRNNFSAANGLTRKLPVGTLYTPPVDTRKFPFFAYLKARPGTGMADDSVGVVTARTQQELMDKIGQLGDQYSVYYKKGQTSLEEYHRVEGDYQFDRNFANNRINTEITRKGILADPLPTTSGENLLQDYLDWHTRQITGLNRDYVELGNAQLFEELRGMGDRFSASAGSKTGWVPPAMTKENANPYQSYINTALNISEKEQYRTWAYANDKLESTFSTAFDAIKRGFRSAQADVIPYDKASDLAESFGLGKIYDQAFSPIKAYMEANEPSFDSKALSKFVAGANTILGTGIIRLDAYQSLIHIITTPMLAAVEAASVRSQILKGMVSTPIPGDEATLIPATSKLLFNAVKNFFNLDARTNFGPLYDALGVDKTLIGSFHEMVDQLSLPGLTRGGITQSLLTEKLDKAAGLGSKLVGILGKPSDWTNTFNHWITCDVGRQIFQSAGFEGKELQDQIMTFANRVQGNYIAAQRPIAFQGPIGQAIGLFQTFGLNMLQNLFRYVENGDAKTLGLLGGLQTSLFGMQGMPGFNFINTHLVGNAVGNPDHNDIYSGIASALGSGKGTLGDYLLYGVTSNWLNANLYSRGDISPRNITVVPLNPLDFPAIKGGINIVSNIATTAQKLANGAPVGASLLMGLEHNGLNRPLSGLAQIAQGFSTTNDGQVIGTTQGINGQSELFSMASFSRLMGARPLDEAAAMGSLSRLGMYKAKTEARINSLGQAAKVSLYNGGSLAPEEVSSFAQSYSAAGGDINKFNSALGKWTSQANASTANKVFKQLRTDGATKNALLEMGGMQLPDFSNSGMGEGNQEAASQ